MLLQLNLEITPLSLKLHHLSLGKQLDVWVFNRFQELGCQEMMGCSNVIPQPFDSPSTGPLVPLVLRPKD